MVDNISIYVIISSIRTSWGRRFSNHIGGRGVAAPPAPPAVVGQTTPTSLQPGDHEFQGRSDSFSSGRSTPGHRRIIYGDPSATPSRTSSCMENEDLVEVDFG